MIIKNVVIDNFKSIDSINLIFDKIGKSYTKTFVGINESGKSNILEALSFFDTPDEKVSFDRYCNQKFENKDYCFIIFYLDFEKNENYNIILSDINQNIPEFYFTLKEVQKVVYLSKNFDSFHYYYNYEVELPSNDYYLIKKQKSNANGTTTTIVEIVDTLEDNAELLTKELFSDTFKDSLSRYISTHEPKVSIWKPSSEYLLSDVNLNTYKKDVNSNKPLRNIFKLSGYTNNDSIVEAIDKINNSRNRSKLVGKLNESLNEYIGKIWNNKIDLLIEITETGTFSLLIKDKGKENEHDRFAITDRSQGAMQFLSLILSLSLETANHERKNELILIDEPEVHLHPSGIRDLSKELLKIGQDNYVFLATHSPFMIDKEHKERHYIVTKNRKAITEIRRIKETDNIIDDEVLNEAFGINVYRDLLNPHSILVEGASDKQFLQKVFSLLGRNNIGISNGHGSNIDTLASKMNYDHISLLVITDDDQDGRKYKNNILKIGGVFNEDNVYTIRDLEGGIIDQGTIEDTLGVKYVESQFLKFYKSKYGEDLLGVSLSEDKPIIIQIVSLLKEKNKYATWDMDSFKKYLSDNFNPTKNALSTNYIKLNRLATKILETLK